MKMKKIYSKEKEAKRQKRNRIAIVVVMIFVLFGSIFGIIVNSFDNSETGSSTVKYGDFSFAPSGGYWTTTFGSSSLIFLYNPLETANVTYETNITNDYTDYSNVPVYIYSEDYTSEAEVYRNLYSIAQRIQNACPSELEGQCEDENWPVKDCTNSLIIIEESDKNEIIQNDGCVYIRGQNEDLIKLSDEFLYRVYGIK